MKTSTLLALFLCFTILNATAQNKEKVTVYLDCNREWLCDFNYVRQEIKMVDFVRDRFLADVHLLVITQFSTGGGEQNQLSFIGLKRFAGRGDTLRYFNNPTSTEDEKRKQLVKYVKLGLISYVSQTPLAEDIQIVYLSKDSTKAQETADQKGKDKWNFWQIRIGASGFFNGNQNITNDNINSSINSSRETNESRTNFSIDMQARKNKYEISLTEKEVVRFRDFSFSGGYLKKLNEHFGIGISGDIINSLYQNLNIRTSLTPKFEYSITPYKKFNSDRIILRYNIGPEYSNYGDTTIYFKTSEWQAKQSIDAIASFTKPWGSVNVGAFWTNYLSDFKKNNLSFNGGISWRIFKGLQFGVGGYYAFVRDQINVKKGGASATDILTQRRALLSNYNYFGGVGFSYTFGSIFNNAVFPAFRGLNWGLNF